MNGDVTKARASVREDLRATGADSVGGDDVGGRRPAERFVKRGLDILGATAALLVSAPLVLALAIAVKLVDRGPAFFAHPREGRGRRRFRMWKVRSMRTDGGRALERRLREDAAARREWDRRFKLDDDPRVLPGIGRFLRRYSLDELPQLWNVLVGDMSLVGPRPLPDYHLERLPEDFLELRARVRPGVTGLWQVHVRSLGELEELELYDRRYLRDWSLALDLRILLRTVRAVVSGKGAV